MGKNLEKGGQKKSVKKPGKNFIIPWAGEKL